MLFNILKIRMVEKNWGGVKYIYYKNHSSSSLLICFSAFPPTNLRLYNNIRGFSKIAVDRLYIGDTWGYRGSYYLYENGQDSPYRKTTAIIDHVLKSKHYHNIYTAGTSKGGSAAIIYGLKYNVDAVFAGACQFYIGNWLSPSVHRTILDKMRGPISVKSFVTLMNEYMKTCIKENRNKDTIVHLLYSKKEHTYQQHIIDLIHELKNNNINVIEIECFFEEHNDVGYSFVPYVNDWFNNNT